MEPSSLVLPDSAAPPPSTLTNGHVSLVGDDDFSHRTGSVGAQSSSLGGRDHRGFSSKYSRADSVDGADDASVRRDSAGADSAAEDHHGSVRGESSYGGAGGESYSHDDEHDADHEMDNEHEIEHEKYEHESEQDESHSHHDDHHDHRSSHSPSRADDDEMEMDQSEDDGNDGDDAADHSYSEEGHDDASDVPHEEYNSTSSSSSSPRSSRTNRGTKRKVHLEDDDYIRNNPELYGLRRSGRARTQRQVIDTSDSESDVVPPSRRKRASAGGRTSRASTAAASQRPSPPMSTSENDSEDDDDDDDDYAPRSRTSKSSKRRRLNRGRHARNSNVPVHAEVRFSTRRANKVTNYAEDDDEDEFLESESEDVMEWAPQVDENIPAIDCVLNHRLKEGVDRHAGDIGREHFEFYIKWQGLSHYHATWETVESVAGCRSTRRLDNYIRKILSQEISLMNESDVSAEEKERWALERERDAEAIEDYRTVERVIGSEKVDGTTQYLVKWRRLGYDFCTWEEASLVSQIAQTEIDRYLDRQTHPPVSRRDESNRSTRTSFEPIHGTPPYLKNGELKEFQVKGVNFMAYNWVRGRNVVLADEMGLGKTVQTVAFIAWLRHVRQQQGPFIVIVPLSTMPSWAETFDNWTPDVNYVVYNGNETARRAIREYELLFNHNFKKPKFHVLLTTYEYVLVDTPFLSQLNWQFMAVDEAHRLKNRESQLYLRLSEFRSPARLLITGTPVQNNLGELSALMDFLNPGVVDIDEEMDLSSEAASYQLAELTKAIQPYMLRRTKSKVETDLPPKSEKIIRVELSDVQLEYYKNILTKNYTALNAGAKGHKQSLLNIMMELKKASNHPFMFPNAEERILEGKVGREEIVRALITSSGKMMLLDQLLAKLKRDGHRVLIFSQMVHMLNILADYMDYRGYSYQRLDGTVAPGPRRMSIEHFNDPESNDFAFLLSTRAGGLGINLMTADTVVLFDSDWNPQADLQAMARAHRIGQTKPVSVYRLVSKDTVEEEVLERAKNKLLLEFITIQRGVTDKEATEIKDKMTRAGHYLNEPSTSDDISRILKRRGQRMFEQYGNQKKLEELDIDSVLENAEEHKTEQAEGMEVDGGEDFLKAFQFVDVKVDELSWDDIIPKEELEAAKAEEARIKEEEFLRQEIENAQPRAKRRETAYEDDRSERRAKRRAREQVMEDASDDAAPPDPSRPLNEKEYRHLVRAYLRYGDIEEHQEETLKEARLVGRDIGVVKAALQEILDKSQRLVDEENERLKALEREGKVFTKKERKAVLFDHHGVKRINAETMLERPNDMRILRQAVQSLANPKSFRIPEATKGTDYTCTWGAREDGMLCVGVVKHGYGAWAQIRDDPELELGDKFFLEEHRVDKKAEREREREREQAMKEGKEKEGATNGRASKTKSPGAVHLVRRIDYLLSVLKDKLGNGNGSSTTAKRFLESHARGGRKSGVSSKAASASPVPPASRKEREQEISRRRSRESIERTRGPSSGDRHKRSQSKNKPRPRASLRDDDELPQPQTVRRDSHSNSHSKPHSHSHSYPHPSSNHHNNHHDRHHHNHHAHAHAHPHENVGNDEDLMTNIFRPARDRLNTLSKLNKDRMPDKAERAKAIRVSLKDIGSFIHDTTRGYPSSRRDWLETRLWEHVCKHYWPNKDTPAAALMAMYKKLVETETLAKASNARTSPKPLPPKPVVAAGSRRN